MSLLKEITNKNILVVSDSQTYLMGNIKNLLQEENFDVFSAGFKVQEIFENLKEPEAIMIYVDEDYEEHIQEMIYLSDRSLESNTPIFLLGDESDISALKEVIPGAKIPLSFARPIDVKEVVSKVGAYIRDNGRSNKKKILVVDDSGAVLRNVKGWLEDKYQLTLANSGATAIKSLSLNRPDLVLLDYEMPIVDGSQVLQMIRAEQDFCDIPVIFLTTKGDRETVMKVMALKPEGYLLKTLPPADIIASIDEFFEKEKMKGYQN